MTDLHRPLSPAVVDAMIAKRSDVLARVERHIASDKRYARLDADTLAAYERERETAEIELAAAEACYTGWTRYYHVNNVGGHIHTSTYCSSCFASTVYNWRTDLSGLTPEEVVQREAYNACSVCMPIAPAEQQAARAKRTAEERETKRAIKSAVADAKLAKAAVRAAKLLVKVDAAYTALGGRDAVAAFPRTGPHSVYARTFELQTSVQDVLIDDSRELWGERRYSKDPRQIIADATERGLI